MSEQEQPWLRESKDWQKRYPLGPVRWDVQHPTTGEWLMDIPANQLEATVKNIAEAIHRK